MITAKAKLTKTQFLLNYQRTFVLSSEYLLAKINCITFHKASAGCCLSVQMLADTRQFI